MGLTNWISINKLGEYTIVFVNRFENIVSYLKEVYQECLIPPLRLYNIIKEMEFIGNQSFSIILLSGFTIGAVFALQIGIILKIFQAESIIGFITTKSLVRELAPIMTAFLLAGRAGSAITAEIATMKVTEQIDAMEAMAVNPIHYLVKTKIIAALIMTPILSSIFVIIGVIGSFIVAVLIFDVNQGIYIYRIINGVQTKELLMGLEKSLIFGAIVVLIACYYGLDAKGGAKGVGEATTRAVISMLLTLLCIDLIITYIQIIIF